MALRADPRSLRVHQLAVKVATEAVAIARRLRGPAAFERGDQLVSAALSVAANIAEACGRGSSAEFRQFLVIARGSAQEVLTHLRITALAEPGLKPSVVRLIDQTALVVKMLTRLRERPPNVSA